MPGSTEEKVVVTLQWLLVSGSSRSGAIRWGGQAARWQWPQHKQCPHQPGQSTQSFSIWAGWAELDADNRVPSTTPAKVRRWIGSEVHSGVQLWATEEAGDHPGEPLNEIGQQGMGRGQGMAQLQHNSGKIWLSGSGLKCSPWTHG